MLETLITLFLVSTFLLGSAGVQSVALKLNKTSQVRNQAVLFASEIAERMETNKLGAIAGMYAYGGGGVTASVDCLSAACSAAELAAFDLVEWSGRVRAALPGATVSIDGAAANPVTYRIVIGWTERRTGQAYATAGTTEAASYTAVRTVFR